MKLAIKSTSNIDEMTDRLGDDVRGGLVAGTTNVCETAGALIDKDTPVATSNLVNSRTVEVSEDGRRGVIRWLADYGRYLIEGTGLFGPRKQKITPKRAKALKTPYGPRKSVKGIRPNDFITRGAEKLDAQDAFETGMGNYLKKKGWTK